MVYKLNPNKIKSVLVTFAFTWASPTISQSIKTTEKTFLESWIEVTVGQYKTKTYNLNMDMNVLLCHLIQGPETLEVLADDAMAKF